MAAYGQASTGKWIAMLIGMVLLVVAVADLIASARAAARRAHRTRRGSAASTTAARPTGELWQEFEVPHARIRALIAEALIVRERLSGEIEAATYQARMKDLVSDARSSAPPSLPRE